MIERIGQKGRIYQGVEDEGEVPTPKALGDLLVAAVREQKVIRDGPHIVYLSPEGAQEIQSTGIDVGRATQAVTNITGVPVAIRGTQATTR